MISIVRFVLSVYYRSPTKYMGSLFMTQNGKSLNLLFFKIFSPSKKCDLIFFQRILHNSYTDWTYSRFSCAIVSEDHTVIQPGGVIQKIGGIRPN